MELAKLTYRLTAGFPSEERYGLAQQMRRAAVSVVSNIAEGAARHSRKEFEQFLHIAKGSLSELDAQFEVAASLGFTREPPMELFASVARMLAGLIRHLRNKSDSGSRAHGLTGSRA